MPATAQIRFSADSREARAAVDGLERELEQLGGQLKQSSTAAEGLGRQSRTTAVSVESLETQIRQIRNESLQYRTTMTQLNLELANNRKALLSSDQAGKEAIRTRNAQIQAEQRFLRVRSQTSATTLSALQEERRSLLGISNSFQEAGRGGGIFRSSLDDITGALGSFGVIEAAFALQQFGAASVRAAAQLEGYQRGLQLIEGTNAPERLEQLIEVANLPGLQLDQLINYSNRLRAVGLSAEQVDKILLSTGQTIISFGGTSDVAAQAVEQITQAISTNTVSLQDFRSIAQRIPSFYQAIADTHNVEASIDGFRDAVDQAGGSVADALIPVMDTLAERFGSPPADSYVVAIDALQNSFFLLQAEIGNNFLPIIAQSANGLAEFFDAIRTNNLGELPAPLQQIVAGARQLWDGLRAIVDTISRSLSPNISELLSALGGLLGEILGLAGSLLETLAPAFTVITQLTRFWTALLTKLVQDVTSVIGALGDFVDWIRGAEEAQDGLAMSTQMTSKAVMDNVNAIVAATNADRDFATQIATLQASITSVNAELERKTQQYQDLIERGANPAHASMQQLDRSIKTLEADSARLTGELGTLRQGFTSVEPPIEAAMTSTEEVSASIRVLTQDINQVDPRLLTFRERSEALTGAIRELPPEITAVSDALRIVSPLAELAEKQFDDLNTTLVNTQKEERALKTVTDSLIISTNALNAATDAQIERGKLVEPEIRRLTLSTRSYAGEVSDLAVEYQDFDDIAKDTTVSLRNQDSAFDKLRGTVRDAADPFDTANEHLRDMDESLTFVVERTGQAEAAFGDFSDEFLNNVGLMLDSLDPFIDRLGDAGSEINNLTGAVVSAITGDIPGLITNVAAIILPGLTEPLRELEFDQPVAGDLQNLEDLGLNLDFSDALDPETFNVDTDAILRLLGLSDEPTSTFDPVEDRRVTEEIADAMYGSAEENSEATVAATMESGQMVVDAIEETMGTAEPSRTEPLRDVFRLTGSQRADLSTLAGDIDTAENRIRALTEDSSPQEVLAAYEALSAAENAYYLQQIAFVDAGVGIFTDSALETARAGLFTDFTNTAFDANRLLARSLENIGFELVNAFTVTSGFLAGSTLAIQQIPEAAEQASEMVAEAAGAVSEPISEPTPEPTPEAAPLRDVFRLTGSQRADLATLAGDIQTAEDNIRLLTEDSSPDEVIAAYQALGTAETAYHNQQLEFINAGVDIFTDSALQTARDNAGDMLRGNLFDANRLLVRSLDDIGFELVNAFTATSGFLAGTALAIQQIPQIVQPATEMVQEAVAEVATVSEPISEPTPEAAPLRDVFRLTGSQRADLATLAGDIQTAEDNIRLLTEDSSPDEVIAAYQALGTAETAYYDRQIAFVDEGIGIYTDDALQTARDTASGVLRGNLFDANQLLVGSLEDIGFELVNTFTATSGFLMDTALAIRRIPEMVAEVAEEVAEVEEVVAEPTPEAEPLRDAFRLTGAQRESLGTLAGDIETAEDNIRLLTEDSSPDEVIAAYQALGTAETAYHNQQLEFINAGVDIFTDSALQTARDNADLALRGSLFDANQLLVRSLDDIGFELVNTFTATSGFLMDTALAIRRIPEMVAEVAEPEPEIEVPEVESINTSLQENAIARARFQLTGATTERGFETARQDLIRAINAYYDLEDERISSLMLSETELRDQREDNQLARDRALRSATTATNRFTQDRIRNEERAVAEQMRLQEAALRESERISAERLRAEERLAEDIADLRQDAFDAEVDYQESRVELAERTAQRLEDIERGRLRRQEDERIDYAREIEDLNRDVIADIDELFEGLEIEASQRGRAINAVLSGLEIEIFGAGFSAGGDLATGLIEIQRGLSEDRQSLILNQTRAFEDIALREDRAIEDVGIRENRQLISLGETRNETLHTINENIATLVEMQSFAIASAQPAPAVLLPTESVGGADVSTAVEVAAPAGRLGGGLAGESGGGFPSEFRATIQIVYPDGAISELQDQVVRLEGQNRALS